MPSAASVGLVRRDWKYLYRPDHGVEQLFDLRSDVAEEHGLAGDANERDRLAEMRRRWRELAAPTTSSRPRAA